MEKDEKKKTGWKTKLILVGSGFLLGAVICYKKENKSLREENYKLQGVKENLETQVKGLSKAIEKLAYNLGKNRRYE